MKQQPNKIIAFQKYQKTVVFQVFIFIIIIFRQSSFYFLNQKILSKNKSGGWRGRTNNSTPASI
jgi:hypothetical protein